MKTTAAARFHGAFGAAADMLGEVLSAEVAAPPPEPVVDGPGVPGLVSVIIPTYNRAYILGAAIDSVLRQSYTSVEVIVIDDGSTDDTRRLVEAYGAPVRYIARPNGGVSAARNTGLRAARGEFVALLDSDDAWHPWKLQAQIALLRAHPEVGMTWGDMTAVDEAGRVQKHDYLRTMYTAHTIVEIEQVLRPAGTLGDVWTGAPTAVMDRPFHKGDLLDAMLLGSLVHTSTVVMRRERLRLVGSFDETLRPSGEDYEFHLRTCSFGAVGFLDAACIDYRMGAKDQLTAPEYMVHIARNTLRTVLRWLARAEDRIALPHSEVTRRLGEVLSWIGDEELHLGNGASARRHLWASVRLRPGDRRTLKLFACSLLPVPVFGAVRRVRWWLMPPRPHRVGEPAHA